MILPGGILNWRKRELLAIPAEAQDVATSVDLGLTVLMTFSGRLEIKVHWIMFIQQRNAHLQTIILHSPKHWRPLPLFSITEWRLTNMF
jgi:hypothetical protein